MNPRNAPGDPNEAAIYLDFAAIRKNIRTLMEERGLRATPWSIAAGLSERYVAAILRRRIEQPAIAKLAALADAAGVPLSRIIGTAAPVAIPEPRDVPPPRPGLPQVTAMLENLIEGQRETDELLRTLIARLDAAARRRG